MSIVVVTAAASEPLTVDQVKAHCHIDSATHQEPAPGVITAALASPAAPGNVDNGAHRYLATFTTAAGETQAGTISAALTVADKTVNGQVALSAIPIGGALVTGRKLYRTIAGGSSYLLLATLANNTATTYTDNIADSGLGAGAPSANTTDDPLIGLLIASARAAAEQELRRYLVTQTLDAYFDAFPKSAERFELMLPPLQSVASIGYVEPDFPYTITTQGIVAPLDADGSDGDVYWDTVTDNIYVKAAGTWGSAVRTFYNVLATTDYLVDAKSQPARITPAYGLSWPATRAQHNAVRVRFVAGYGAASAVPACVRNWMLMRIRTLWENRSQLVVGANNLLALPASFVDGLLDPERVVGRMFA